MESKELVIRFFFHACTKLVGAIMAMENVIISVEVLVLEWSGGALTLPSALAGHLGRAWRTRWTCAWLSRLIGYCLVSWPHF